MIKYSLRCKEGHEFESWFSNSSAYDKLADADQVFCPACGSHEVQKALMAPSVVTAKAKPRQEMQVAAGPENKAQTEVLELFRKVKAFVEQNSEYVGPRFAEEALKIHHEEVDARSIYGEASKTELEDLKEEGVDVYPLPVLPEDHN